MTPAGLLADAVCDGRLVVVTGAGLSQGLRNASDEAMPDWGGALKRLGQDPALPPEVQTQVVELVAKGATGQDFALAAGLLDRHLGSAFTNALTAMFTLHPVDGLTARSKDYAAVHDLKPRGIITFNVDGAHRRWITENDDPSRWVFLDPTSPADELEFGQLLRAGFSRPFLLEAHGSVATEPVFTSARYRNLFGRSPAYRAFLQHVLSSQRLLVVGFSLADHDFNRVLDDLANAYGAPVHDHVWISPLDPSSSRDYLRLSEMYGIAHFELRDWGDLASVLATAATVVSPRLQQIIEDSTSPKLDIRREGHRQAAALSSLAKRNLVDHLLAELTTERLRDHKWESVFTTSEMLYLMRRVGGTGNAHERQVASALVDALERMTHTELLAHGILALEAFAGDSNLPALHALADKWASEVPYADPHFPDPGERVVPYLRKLILEVEARQDSPSQP